MFEAERFVADCRAAFAEDPTHKAVREVLASPVSNPAAVLKGLGEPKRAEIQKLFHSNALTIINVVWAPGMMVMPHNHRMWAVIGIYTGREDNVFWRRVKGTPNKIEASGKFTSTSIGLRRLSLSRSRLLSFPRPSWFAGLSL